LEEEALMFFVLSKSALLLIPSNFLFAVGLVGLLLLVTRWRRAGRFMLITSFVVLLFFGTVPIGGGLLHILEQRFPPWDTARGAPDGIVVLGGAISPRLSRIYGTPQLGDNAERVTVIAALARTYPDARVGYT
jgi:uncharacterized SAM-binding protein YcdF (DUF218 family)